MAIEFRDDSTSGPTAAPGTLSDINTTPLVDVMLVLLIIFLITIPVINTSVAVKLPRQVNLLRQAQANTVVISVDSAGHMYWFDTRLTDLASLRQRLGQAANVSPQPEVHIRADARADFEAVGHILQASQAAGIERVGFVTEPPATRGR